MPPLAVAVSVSSTGTASLRMGNWRFGDLCILEKVSEATGEDSVDREEHPRWYEVNLDGCRVRFSRTVRREGDVSLKTVVPGDILPTVSRRDPRRSSVSVWTSGNRVFACGDPVRLCKALRHWIRRGEAARISSIAQQSCQYLGDIAALENDEQRD